MLGVMLKMTIRDLAERIIRITNSRSEIRFLPPLKEGDMSRRCPEVTKMRQVLGREIIDLDEGINNLIRHYEDRK